MIKNKLIGVRVNEETYNDLEKRAKIKRITISEVIRKSCRKAMTYKKEELWNILLLLDKVAAERIFRNNRHWENYKELWNTPLWYAGVNLRRMYENNPKGAFHHELPYMKHYVSIFTTGKFIENHKKGAMNID